MTRSAPSIGIAEIKPLLQQRALELARQLAPGGAVSGKAYTAPNPTRQDRRAGSFVIWIKGPATGSFIEYASNEKGDVIDLLIYLQQARDRAGALAWAKKWVGIEGAGAAEIKAIKARASERRKKVEAEQAEADERRKKWANGIWLKCSPVKKGDKVWTYLDVGRCIPMDRLWKTRKIGSLRKAERLEYKWRTPENLDSKWHIHRPENGTSWHPAMVAIMSPPNGGRATAIHRTYLSADGALKAHVPSAKKMAGMTGGMVIKLWRGETGLSAADAVKKNELGPLILTEGIEDGLSIAAMTPENRVWAVGSLGNLGRIEWPKCASEVIIAADNDWDKPQAVRAFDAYCERLSKMGPVKVMRSPTGKDFNDLLRAEKGILP